MDLFAAEWVDLFNAESVDHFARKLHPTTANSKTTDGIGVGSFTSTLSGLASNTTYYVRAYSTNSVGTTYGNELSFLTMDAAPLPSITICSQVWMTQNLDVSTYRNGDPIPQVTGSAQWANLTTGAWCWYNNNSSTGATYGKLYNWYAVNDPRGLAPAGWHIPTDAEWTTLETCLGTSLAGGKMKETGTIHWISPNAGATNSSGFTGLPGGARNNSGTFFNIGGNGGWWSSTEYNTSSTWNRDLSYANGFLGGYYYDKEYGFSVRCIRD